MSDILLIYPRPTLDSPLQELALGIMYLGATLEENGFDVTYIDERFDDEKDIYEAVRNGVKAVGVSAMTGYQLVRTEEIFKKVRGIDPSIFTIMGGVHPSLLPEECLKEPFVDFVVIGEGEETLLELMQAIKDKKPFDKIESVGWKKPSGEGDEIRINNPRKFIDPAEYVYPLTPTNKRYFVTAAKTGELSLPTSRGCPHRCRFCYNMVFNRKTWRPIPVDVFEKHLTRLLDDLKDVPFKHMFLLDDNISRNKARIKTIGKILTERNITWHSSIRPEYITEEMATLLDRSGCRGLLLGIESGSNRVLNEVIRKDLPNGVDDIKTCANHLSKTRIQAIYSFMCNIPSETSKDLRESMDLADWISRTDPKGRLSFYVYAPYPGTELYQEALSSGFKEPKNFGDWAKITLSNDQNPIAENIYYIAGLHFRGGKGDRTDQNFPGIQRLKIALFESLVHLRWRSRFFKFFGLEKAIIKRLLENASRRVRNN